MLKLQVYSKTKWRKREVTGKDKKQMQDGHHVSQCYVNLIENHSSEKHLRIIHQTEDLGEYHSTHAVLFVCLVSKVRTAHHLEINYFQFIIAELLNHVRKEFQIHGGAPLIAELWKAEAKGLQIQPILYNLVT